MSYQIPDTSNVDLQNSVPEGTYTVKITNYEVKQSRAGNEYVELTLEIQDGDHGGRELRDRLSLEHPNKNVVDIALRQLASLKEAAGVPQSSTSLDDVCDKPVRVKVKHREYEGVIYADVKRYMAVGDAGEGADTPVWQR